MKFIFLLMAGYSDHSSPYAELPIRAYENEAEANDAKEIADRCDPSKTVLVKAVEYKEAV